MKKILFATTALVATASVAAADVSFGGYARFGVHYLDDVSAGTSSTDITHRFRLQIDATAESDSGVEFGARARIQRNAGDDNGAFGNAQGINGVRFYARSSGFELGVGNIFGAIESMPGQYPIDLGLTGLGYDYTAYGVGGADAYSSGGNGASNNNGIEVMYSIGDFKTHLSYSEGTGPSGNDRTAIYAAYTFSGWTAALGYQDSDTTDVEWTASISGDIGPASISLATAETYAGVTRTVLAAGFEVGAATNIEAFVADQDGAADTAYGIDFNHSLGGGTSLRGGVAKRFNGDTRADFGVRFNF